MDAAIATVDDLHVWVDEVYELRWQNRVFASNVSQASREGPPVSHEAEDRDEPIIELARFLHFGDEPSYRRSGELLSSL
jgi:hypothetical protein